MRNAPGDFDLKGIAPDCPGTESVGGNPLLFSCEPKDCGDFPWPIAFSRIKRVVVVGAGYAGLAAAWHLLQYAKVRVTLIDSVGVGGSASGLAAGLLHPYTGLQAKLNGYGREGMEETRSLLEVSSNALGRKVYEESGILRIAVTDRQCSDYLQTSQIHADVDWRADCSREVPGIVPRPGIFIRSGMTVYSRDYLEGLWKDCEERGAEFLLREVSSLSELDSFDAIVLASGMHIKNFVDLPLRPVKGQLLEFKWPEVNGLLPFSINSQVYFAVTKDRKTVVGGATFEKDFEGLEPDLERAESLLLPKLRAIYPKIDHMECLSCRAAVRVSTPNHMPIVKRVSEKVWAFTGLGSKGLLYHAIFAKKLAKTMME